jgi:oxygen-independent coproporphyrinogen-3 oxidase
MQAQRRVSQMCLDRGYVRTSVWSFTKKGKAPYTTVTRDSYRGFGAGAGSKIDGLFSFNTFSVDAYSSAALHRPALVLRSNEKFRRFHWLYWQIYRTEIETREYARLFGRSVEEDFKTIFFILKSLGWIHKENGVWRLKEAGVDWSHRLQSLFSLTFIDTLWTKCQNEAWPERVELT